MRGREQTRYRGWIRIVAAGPSIDVESVGADADDTDQDVRRMKAGMHSLRRYTGYLRTAFKRPN